MGRKLNLMLFEIAENPRSAFMSKEAFERLFQSETVRMNDHMENIQFAGQRTKAGFHHIDNMSADLEVGWAYRLIEKFGTRHVLFESESCKGARYLEPVKVPNSLRQGMVTTYHQERYDAEGQRFITGNWALMEEHGLLIAASNSQVSDFSREGSQETDIVTLIMIQALSLNDRL